MGQNESDLSQARIKPGYVLSPEQILPPDMRAEDWRDFREGIRLFNAGAYWESHESWEFVWKRCQAPSRVFFQALIQLAAAYHQLGRGIHHGVVKHFRNAATKLEPFPDRFLGVDVGALREALSSGEAEALRLGREGLSEFDRGLIATIRYDHQN